MSAIQPLTHPLERDGRVVDSVRVHGRAKGAGASDSATDNSHEPRRPLPSKGVHVVPTGDDGSIRLVAHARDVAVLEGDGDGLRRCVECPRKDLEASPRVVEGLTTSEGDVVESVTEVVGLQIDTCVSFG